MSEAAATGARTDRDRWGIPRHTAGDLLALAHEQGRVVARDRTWQLEWGRRRATGTTAELVGVAGVPWDGLALRVDLPGLGRRALASLDRESAAFVGAFVEGVNLGLASAECPELAHLGVDPGRWDPWVPPALFAAHHLLFATYPTKLWRDHLRSVLPADLVPLFHDEGRWVGDRWIDTLNTAGSNAWVVGGDRTASGWPLIGGDPHRTFESPNGYQQVRLICEDPEDGFDVVGFTFPGIPGVQHFAHAGEVAWGITNAMADYQDLLREDLRRTESGEVEALGPDGWEPVTRTRHRIGVRDAGPVEVEALRTVRGPVIHGGPDDAVALSLRTPSLVLGDVGFSALLPLLRARRVGDVTAALSGWVEPVNNLVAADVDGAVVQQVVGRVPLRSETARWVPVRADSTEHAWRGWVEDLPGRVVAPDGHVVTANQRLDPDFDRIGVEFAPPGRADRIEALLGERRDLTPADFAAIHRDDLAGQPVALLAALRDLAPEVVDGLSAPVAELRERLLAWDQRFAVDSREAAAYVEVRTAFVRRLAATPALARLAPSDRSGGSPFGPLYAGWFDPVTQLYLSLENVTSPSGRAALAAHDVDVDVLLAAALADWSGLSADWSQLSGDWSGFPSWGEQHRFEPSHVLGGEFALPVTPEVAGDNDCVRCTGSVPGSTVAFRGSVARYVWDLAGRSTSGWVVPLGASGRPGDPHHHDQLDAWVQGRLVPLEDPETR